LVTVSWNQSKEMSLQLMESAQAFEEQMIADLAHRKGIYVFVYEGTELGGTLWHEPEPSIVYIGHTGEDSARHWHNDTAVSTVRRSLAAMLAGDLHLEARPKSDDPEDEDRFSNYRLEETSELVLTAWMKEHIRVAFLDLEEEETEAWYQAMVDYNTPMFVFRNNPNNSYGPQIKLYRARLAEQAAQL